MIFLIGYMCAGKTTTAKCLAELLDSPFYDLDAIIEKKYEISINDIFRKYGEEYFRNVETETLKDLIKLKKPNSIVACGGGTSCFNNNIELMKTIGIIIYLKVEVDIICERIEKSNIIRPLVEGLKGENLIAFIKKQLAEREYFYNKANIIAEKDNLQISNLQRLISACI